MHRLPFKLLVLLIFLPGCGKAPTQPTELTKQTQSLLGVPEDGYPNYNERLMLVAINRGRSEPNSVALGTSGACGGNGSTPFAVSDPLVLNLAGSKAARFHCANCMLNAGGLSHDSYCTLKQDIAQTNCDGSMACACEAGSDHFNCTTGGGSGTDPWSRTSRFGFSANGEVGSVGYSDGWTAVDGWIQECPDYEGHRRILLEADHPHSQIGLGFTGGTGDCWTRFYFGDTSNDSVNTPTLPAGCHHPETGSNPSFYLNVYDPGGGIQSAHVVIDGTCHPMAHETGTYENGTYKAQVSVGSGCHRYWFLVRDGSGTRHTYPAVGAWGCGSCTDYEATAAEANCETCTNGETKACGTDVGACQAGQQTCAAGAWGACQGAIGPGNETCNEIDDNCDGQTDEGCDCVDGQTRSCGQDQGACQAGQQTCAAGAWGSCRGAIDPVEEICDNAIDEDCDGSTDEGCTCASGQTQACGSDEGVCQAGTQTCQNDAWAECAGAIGPTDEICENALDDDCDGQTDEDCEPIEPPGNLVVKGGCGCDQNGQPQLDFVLLWFLLLVSLYLRHRSART